jgi:transcriptional regulator with XRE-family HTH domain
LTYGKKTQELRRQKAWTQEQLAKAAGLDVRTIQRVEKDQTKSPETVQALAGAFDVDIEDLRTTTLIPQTKLAGTWLTTSYREFISAERTRPAQQFARMVASPLTEEGQDRVDELLRQIFADRDLIQPNEPELWSCYEEQIREPLQSLFDLGQAFFIVDERRDFILQDPVELQPVQRCIPNWRILYYVVVPRHGCFQAGPEKPMHRFNPECRESAMTLFRMVRQVLDGVLVHANALCAVTQAGSEDQINWCDACFPQPPGGQRIGLEYIMQVTGKDEADLYADYLEATGHSFIVGLS